MSTFLNIFLFLIVFLLLLVASIFSAIAAADLKPAGNSSLQTAFHHLVWASVVGWIAVALIILAVILYFVYGAETISATGSTVVIVLLGFVAIMVLVVGILSAIAASNIHSSGTSGSTASTSYRNAIISAVTALGGLGLLIILFFVFIGVQHRAKIHSTITALSATSAPNSPTVNLELAKLQAQQLLAKSPTVAVPTGATRLQTAQVARPAQTAQGARTAPLSPIAVTTNAICGKPLNQISLSELVACYQQAHGTA